MEYFRTYQAGFIRFYDADPIKNPLQSNTVAVFYDEAYAEVFAAGLSAMGHSLWDCDQGQWVVGTIGQMFEGIADA